MEVLVEIEKIMDNSEYDDCCIGGDLNCDERRDSGFVNTVKEFMNRMGLRSVWEKHMIDFTHVHTDLKIFFIVDKLYMKFNLLDQVDNASALHNSSNQFTYSLLMKELGMSVTSVNIEML